MPATSAVRAWASTSITWVSPEVSRPLASVFARVRNRFEVVFASLTGAVGKGAVALQHPLHADGVSGLCVSRWSGHSPTLVVARSGVKASEQTDRASAQG